MAGRSSRGNHRSQLVFEFGKEPGSPSTGDQAHQQAMC